MIPKELLKKIKHIEIRTRHAVSDALAGQYHSVFKGQGMEFDEVREYLPGDDVRSIDWNVTARMGHPYIKKFIEERELTIMLLVDVSASNRFAGQSQSKRDLAAEVAAVLAFAAIRNQDRVGLVLFSDKIEHVLPPGKGSPHVLRVIRDVLYTKPSGQGTRIGDALTYLNHIAHRRTIAFLISDFLDQDYQSALRISARRHDLIGVRIQEKHEREWPNVGLVEWFDAETGRRALIDTSSPVTRTAYQQRMQKHEFQWLETMRGAGVDTLSLTCGEPYIRELNKFFRMRVRRRAA